MCRVPSEFSQRSCCQLNVQIFYAFSSQCLYLISTGIQVATSSQIFFKIPELNSPHCTIVKNIKTSFRKQFILTIWIIFTKLYAKEYFWYILSYLIFHDLIRALYAVSTHHTPVVFLFYNQSDTFHTYQVSAFCGSLTHYGLNIPLPLRKIKPSLLPEPCHQWTLLHSQSVPESYEKSKNC